MLRHEARPTYVRVARDAFSATARTASAVSLALVLLGTGLPCAWSGETATKTTGAAAYPLSTELAVLERDLTSSDYRAVLATMIPTDLEAEWQRVATVDNYLVFAEQHGGPSKIAGDPALRADYERRRHIADNFLAMVREAYAKRRKRPPFEDKAKLETVLHSAGAAWGARGDWTP